MARGGFRPGSGRQKGSQNSTDSAPALNAQTPLEYLLAVMNDPAVDPVRRDRAAAVAAPFVHKKMGEPGKKGEKQKAAEVAASGKFKPAAPPKLVVNND